jgi:hypothetical protein
MEGYSASAILVLIIPGIITLLRNKGLVNSDYAALVAFTLGCIAGVVLHQLGVPDGENLVQAAINGAMIGGTATGLYTIKHKLVDKAVASVKEKITR